MITNYKEGVHYIEGEKIFGGNTSKNRIFGKGNLWLTPTDCKRGILKEKSLIKTMKYNLYKDSLIIVNRSNVGETVLYKKDIYGPAQHNQGMYRIEIEKGREIYNIFILNWFNSQIFQDKFISNISTGVTFKEIRINDISEKSPIPNFPEFKQQEIAKLYYNPLDKNKDITLKNYLEKEKMRNSEVGIFQLNMEIFELGERLEELVDAVVMERKD